MGPWVHGFQLSKSIGDINFGMLAESQGSQVSEHTIAFFNKYLKGMDEPLLDGPSDAYPEVQISSRNT